MKIKIVCMISASFLMMGEGLVAQGRGTTGNNRGSEQQTTTRSANDNKRSESSSSRNNNSPKTTRSNSSTSVRENRDNTSIEKRVPQNNNQYNRGQEKKWENVDRSKSSRTNSSNSTVGSGRNSSSSNGDRYSSNRRDNEYRYSANSSAARRGYSHSDRVIVSRSSCRPVHSLPSGYKVYSYNNRRYYCHDGLYYERFNGAYRVMHSPFGIRISVLPRGYSRFFFGNITYAYFGGVLYRPVPYSRVYEVVEPEIGMILPSIPFEYADMVKIGRETFYEIDGYLYQPIQTRDGIQFRVEGSWYS